VPEGLVHTTASGREREFLPFPTAEVDESCNSRSFHAYFSMKSAIKLLEGCSLTPTPQRLAVAKSVMDTHKHLSANAVFRRAKRICPSVSRATVYNTLNLLVEKHVLKAQRLLEETTVFDANTQPHHHFVDEETGEIIDIPWEDLSIRGQENLKSVEVRDFQVVIRGKRKK